MADATARFVLETAVSAPGADSTAAQLESLKAKIDADTKALREMQAALRNMQQGANVGGEAFKNLRDQIAAKKEGLASAQAQFVGLGGTFGKAAEGAEAAAESQKGLLDVVQAGGGPIGGYAGRLKHLGEVLGQLGPGGVIAIAVVGVLALTAAVVVAIAATMKFALGLADAARSAQLLHEGATGSAAGAKELAQAVSDVGAAVATPRAELDKLGDELARAGLRGQALRDAFFAVGMTGAVMGQQAGSALQALAEKAQDAGKLVLQEADLKKTGLALEDVGAALAKRLGITTAQAVAALKSGAVKLEDGITALRGAAEAKFGPIAKEQLLALPTQIAKAKDAIDHIFSGVDIKPFLEGLHQVLSLLDENTASGKALKAIAETLLNPLFEAVGSQGGTVRAFFQGMIIAALMFAIAVVRAKNELKGAFGGASADIDLVSGALRLGAGFVNYFTGGVMLAVQAFTWLSSTITSVVGVISGALDSLGSIDLGATARDLVTGFVNDLIGGNGAVAQAAKNLATSALTAIKNTLGIHSPSVEAGRLAGYTTEGFARRVEKDAPMVQGAMASAFALPAAPAGSARPMAPTSSGAPAVYHFAFGDLYLGGRKVARDPELETELAGVFERALARAGRR